MVKPFREMLKPCPGSMHFQVAGVPGSSKFRRPIPMEGDKSVGMAGYRPLWFIDGEAYDLSEFLGEHPGGAIYLCWRDRDWSISFNTYHKNPARAKALIAKYKVENGSDSLKQMRAIHVPESALPFLPENFDARTGRCCGKVEKVSKGVQGCLVKTGETWSKGV